jgi:hypothetical protein
VIGAVTCWPTTRNEVMRRFPLATNAYFSNVCERLEAKENLALENQMKCERASDAWKSNAHVPATPLDGSRWIVEALPDQASSESGAKPLLVTVEFANGWITTLSKQGFSSEPIEYSGSGNWTSRQWASQKMKAEWRGQVGEQTMMEGSLTVSKSDGTTWMYSFTCNRLDSSLQATSISLEV